MEMLEGHLCVVNYSMNQLSHETSLAVSDLFVPLIQSHLCLRESADGAAVCAAAASLSVLLALITEERIVPQQIILL